MSYILLVHLSDTKLYVLSTNKDESETLALHCFGLSIVRRYFEASKVDLFAKLQINLGHYTLHFDLLIICQVFLVIIF